MCVKTGWWNVTDKNAFIVSGWRHLLWWERNNINFSLLKCFFISWLLLRKCVCRGSTKRDRNARSRMERCWRAHPPRQHSDGHSEAIRLVYWRVSIRRRIDDRLRTERQPEQRRRQGVPLALNDNGLTNFLEISIALSSFVLNFTVLPVFYV